MIKNEKRDRDEKRVYDFVWADRDFDQKVGTLLKKEDVSVFFDTSSCVCFF